MTLSVRVLDRSHAKQTPLHKALVPKKSMQQRDVPPQPDDAGWKWPLLVPSWEPLHVPTVRAVPVGSLHCSPVQQDHVGNMQHGLHCLAMTGH
mmetsp:Transcript_120717/g.240412  ORF Transcript_120717/g.240412 Transcript_120717/m.240412 type:complete len:93 (+) Transcript_120717:431-709(+)